MLTVQELQAILLTDYNAKGFLKKWQSVTPKWAGDLAELGLIHTEISETMEAVRDGDEEHMAEELAGIVIRVLNFASRHNINLMEYITEEFKRNTNRPFLHGRKVI